MPYQRALGAGGGHEAAPLVDGETHQLILVRVHHDRGRGDLVLRREEIHHLDTAWLVPGEHHHLSVTTPQWTHLEKYRDTIRSEPSIGSAKN